MKYGRDRGLTVVNNTPPHAITNRHHVGAGTILPDTMLNWCWTAVGVDESATESAEAFAGRQWFRSWQDRWAVGDEAFPWPLGMAEPFRFR